MALLDRRDRVETKAATFRLPRDVVELLDKYARYLNRDKSEVVVAALEHAVRLDEEFCHSAGIAPATGRRGRRIAEAQEVAAS